MLRDDQDFSFRHALPDPPASFEAVHSWHAHIEHDDVWLQSICFLHGFDAIFRFIDNLPLGPTAK
jgi:hypothetical protein